MEWKNYEKIVDEKSSVNRGKWKGNGMEKKTNNHINFRRQKLKKT